MLNMSFLIRKYINLSNFINKKIYKNIKLNKLILFLFFIIILIILIEINKIISH